MEQRRYQFDDVAESFLIGNGVSLEASQMCRLFIGIVSFFSLVAAGCKPTTGGAESSASPSQVSTPNTVATSPAEDGDFTLSVSLNRVDDGGEEMAFRRTYPKPTPGVIEEQVKSIDWASAPNRPYVIIGRMLKGQINQMKLQGTLKKPNEDGAFRLLWAGVEDGHQKALRSPPLESVDAAIALLISFSQDNSKWRTMTAWEDVTEGSVGE